MKRKVLIFFLVLVALSLCVLGGGRFILGMSLPKLKGKLELQGLSAQVDVYRDRYGIPHIYAQNRNDLMFAAGFVTAQDRLWQMDLLRRAATGRLAEIFGEDALRSDILMRVLGLERVAKRQYQMLSPQNAAILTSYSEGINACIKNLRTLPPEFHLLRYQPQPWQPTDSLAISRLLGWQLSRNYESEIVMMKLASKFGGQRAAALGPFYPRQGPFILPPDLTEGIIKAPLIDDSGVLEKIVGTSGGSNSWVLASSRTTTGAPLLANDPHLSGTRMPSLWYYVHLVGSGFDVIGAVVPGMPLPLLGHNESIGWGITNMNADVQDLYIERVNPQDPNLYEYNGAWVDMDTTLEHIPFRSAGGKTLYIDREVRRTIHGPVINDAVPNVLNVVSLNWTGLKPTRDFEALLELNLAKNWNDFRGALASLGVAPQNFIYADTRGNIGYCGAGEIPVRLNGGSMFPRSGWMRSSGWNGAIPPEKMPHSFNPAAGFIVTANNRVVGDEYEYFISSEWAPSFRSRRIIELIKGRPRHDVKSIETMQMDTKSLLAETILKQVAPALESIQEPELRKAARLLANWDCNLTVDSPAALMYHRFVLNFARNTFSDEMGRDLADEYLAQYYLWQERFVKLMEQDSRWFDDVDTDIIETRDIIAARSFEEAIKSLKNQYGENMHKWRWGTAHRIIFQHPLDKNPIAKRLFDMEPFPFPGDGETVNRGTFDFGKPYAVTMAASIRNVMDFSALDKTAGIHTTGQSGNTFSRHYDDFTDRWMDGEYISLMMNRADFIKKSEGYLKLLPMKQQVKPAGVTRSKGK